VRLLRVTGLAFLLHKTKKAPAADSPVTPSWTWGGDTLFRIPPTLMQYGVRSNAARRFACWRF